MCGLDWNSYDIDEEIFEKKFEIYDNMKAKLEIPENIYQIVYS